MRNALVARNNGASPLPQVLLLLVLLLLLLLLQVLPADGNVVYRRTEKRVAPLFVEDANRTPEDERAKAGPNSAGSNDTAPHIRALGFFARGHVVRTADELRRMLPEIVNETGVAERAKDATRWHHRFIVGSRRNNGTRPNRQGGGLQASPLSSSSHFGIPHLVKLGFGAANRKPVYRYPEVDEPGTPVRDGYPATSGGLHHMVVLGVGSFLGGMLVILLLFSALLLRRKRRQRHRSAEGGFRSPDKVGEPKLGLLRHEVTPANDDVGNELSTTSCSSTSSGSGDTSSHTSDTSHISDTWPPCPDNVVLLTFCDDGDRTREQEVSRETGNSAAYHQKLRQEADASLLAWPQEQQQQQQPQYGENPAHAKCSTSRSCSWSDDEHPFSQSSDNGVSSTGSRFLRIEDEALLAGTLPDLLLPSRPTMTERFLHDTTSCTKTVCAEGGIVSCAGGDVVIIIPPGSVQEECRLRVQVNDDTSSCRIEDRAGALILSPVIDVNVLGAEFFHRPITLKIPYRALCSCVNGVLSLRCWHQPSPTWIPTGRTLRNGVVNHYTWPECFSPEPGVPDEDGCLRTRVATYNCFSNVCTIQTNTSGTFCLTSQSREHSASCGEQRLCTVSASHHDNNIRLCVAVGAKYHFDYGETDGVTYGETDGVTSKSRIRQINYTICMSDNTASGRQGIEEFIRTSGGRVQCACVPLDVAMGSAVKVTLDSVRDPQWPWEIPFDSTSKIIRWKEFCDDYNSLVRVEFRCLPRSDDVLTLLPDDVNIVSTFHVDTDQHTVGGLDAVRINIVADSGY